MNNLLDLLFKLFQNTKPDPVTKVLDLGDVFNKIFLLLPPQRCIKENCQQLSYYGFEYCQSHRSEKENALATFVLTLQSNCSWFVAIPCTNDLIFMRQLFQIAEIAADKGNDIVFINLLTHRDRFICSEFIELCKVDEIRRIICKLLPIYYEHSRIKHNLDNFRYYTNGERIIITNLQESYTLILLLHQLCHILDNQLVYIKETIPKLHYLICQRNGNICYPRTFVEVVTAQNEIGVLTAEEFYNEYLESILIPDLSKIVLEYCL
jgi:hypothetical protein